MAVEMYEGRVLRYISTIKASSQWAFGAKMTSYRRIDVNTTSFYSCASGFAPKTLGVHYILA